jgi:hypothetical protein
MYMGDEREMEISVAEVVDYLRMTGGFAPALREVVKRRVAAEEAAKRGVTVSDQELQKAADAFRQLNGLQKAADTEWWMKANGVSVETLEGFLETNLMISKLKDMLAESDKAKKYRDRDEVKSLTRELMFADWVQEQLD